MVITLPVGTYFETSREVSDLIARRDAAVLVPGDATEIWTVLVRDVHGDRPGPDPGDLFEIQSANDRIGMRNVMWLYQGMNLDPRVEPAIQRLSLSIASGDPGYDDLVQQAAGAPIPVGEAVALAAAYAYNSGTDITLKRIWTERNRFIPSLTDAGLRGFFEALDQR